MTLEVVFNTIAQHAADVIPGLKAHAFTMDDSLKNLGANSVDRSEIVMLTLESLSLNIPLIELARAENLGDLARILHGKL